MTPATIALTSSCSSTASARNRHCFLAWGLMVSRHTPTRLACTDRPVSETCRTCSTNWYRPAHARQQSSTMTWGCAPQPLIWSKKWHRSVTTNILLPDMFLRCDKNIGNYPILTDLVFVRLDAKKRERAPRWRWIVDVFFQVTAELQGVPIDNSDSI